LYNVLFKIAFNTGFRSTLNNRLRFGFEKNESRLSDGIRRNLLDDTVATKSERSNMCVGIADSGYCANGCFDVCVAVALICGSAVVELRRVSNVLKPLMRALLLAMHRSVDLVSRC
jgi:hypothetical protein